MARATQLLGLRPERVAASLLTPSRKNAPPLSL